MKNEKKAIKKLLMKVNQSKLSLLYKKKWKILKLVPDLYIAWHAGKSSWKNYKSLNKYSIGIEIQNPGHEFNIKNFQKNK